jgi:hypothetical protein
MLDVDYIEASIVLFLVSAFSSARLDLACNPRHNYGR